MCQTHWSRLHRHGTTERVKQENAGRTCSATGCDRGAQVKGMCRTCEVRSRRHGGDPDARTTRAAQVDTLEIRLWRRTEVVSGGPLGDCWVYTGFASGKDGSQGYRGISVNGQNRYAHRAAYAEFVDPAIDGLDVHHRCGTKGCWRPEHLEALTRLEHRQRHR